MVIKLKFNLDNLIPTKKILIDIIFITVAVLIVNFILNIVGADIFINKLPVAYRLIIKVGLGVYLKSLFDLSFIGRNIL